MNLQTVITNLRNTIAGKEELLTLNQDQLTRPFAPDDVNRFFVKATIEFLIINIDELKRILQDVEQCVAKDVEQSWRDNPDRMGGQFTQDEIDNAGRWI